MIVTKTASRECDQSEDHFNGGAHTQKEPVNVKRQWVVIMKNKLPLFVIYPPTMSRPESDSDWTDGFKVEKQSRGSHPRSLTHCLWGTVFVTCVWNRRLSDQINCLSFLWNRQFPLNVREIGRNLSINLHQLCFFEYFFTLLKYTISLHFWRKSGVVLESYKSGFNHYLSRPKRAL